MIDEEKRVRKEICNRWAAFGLEELGIETRKKLIELLEGQEEDGEVIFPMARDILLKDKEE